MVLILCTDDSPFPTRTLLNSSSTKDCLFKGFLMIWMIVTNAKWSEPSAMSFFSFVDSILTIQVERDAENDPGDSIPPVLPHELVKLRTKAFGITILHRHLPQLKKSWSDEQVA